MAQLPVEPSSKISQFLPSNDDLPTSLGTTPFLTSPVPLQLMLNLLKGHH